MWKNFDRLLFLTLWITGLFIIWQLVPVGGWEGWQIPEDEFIVGFLRDGSTLVTVPRSKTGDRIVGTKESGPIRLWNIYTGQLLAEYFDKDYVVDRVLVDENDCIKVQEEVKGKPDEFLLRLLDARTGKEINAYSCRVPQKNIWWNTSPNGKYSIFQSFEGEKPHIELQDHGANRMIKRLEGWREPLRFSEDGALFFAHDEQRKDMGVFSVSNGELVAHLKTDPANTTGRYASPNSISPDNTLLVDSECQVWDIKTGKQRFSVPNIYYGSMAFTPNSKYLAVVAKGPSSYWIAWYDTSTGHEDITRRTLLGSGDLVQMTLSPVTVTTPTGRNYLEASGTPYFTNPPDWKKWIAKVTRWDALIKSEPVDEYLIVDIDSAQIVCRGPYRTTMLSPNGETLVLSGRDFRYELCDIPPRKPIRRYLLLCVGASLLLLLPVLIRRRLSRKVPYA